MRPPLSEFDRDALAIHGGTVWLNARMNPNYQDVETTDIYRRGRELFAETVAARKEGRSERVAAILKPLVGFEIPADRRELSSEQLTALIGAHLVIFVIRQLPAFQEAWQQQLSKLPFPIRVEGTRFLYRNWKGDWEEDEEHTAALQNFAIHRTATKAAL
jgi:hypothetical protein